MEIETKAPDGTYGPFHFLCDIVVKDGKTSVVPRFDSYPDGGHLVHNLTKVGQVSRETLEWVKDEPAKG